MVVASKQVLNWVRGEFESSDVAGRRGRNLMIVEAHCCAPHSMLSESRCAMGSVGKPKAVVGPVCDTAASK